MNNKNAKLICAGGIYDHIHLYASLPSTITVADFVSVVKSNSSRWVHQSSLKRRALAWQEGYGAFSLASASRKSRKSSGILEVSNATMANGVSRTSFSSFLISTRLNMTNDIYGIDLYRPFGPLTK